MLLPGHGDQVAGLIPATRCWSASPCPAQLSRSQAGEAQYSLVSDLDSIVMTLTHNTTTIL